MSHAAGAGAERRVHIGTGVAASGGRAARAQLRRRAAGCLCARRSLRPRARRGLAALQQAQPGDIFSPSTAFDDFLHSRLSRSGRSTVCRSFTCSSRRTTRRRPAASRRRERRTRRERGTRGRRPTRSSVPASCSRCTACGTPPSRRPTRGLTRISHGRREPQVRAVSHRHSFRTHKSGKRRRWL